MKQIRNLLRMIFIALLAVIIVYAIVKFIPDVVDLLKSGNEQEMESYIASTGKRGVLIIVALQEIGRAHV